MMIYHGQTLGIIQSPTRQEGILLGNNNQQQPATTIEKDTGICSRAKGRNVSNLNHLTPFAPLKPTKIKY